jgi:hypothetical protein
VGGGGGPQSLLDHNPIVQYFDIGKQTASAGPELVWRIHDAYRKTDGKVSKKNYPRNKLFIWYSVLKSRHRPIFLEPK